MTTANQAVLTEDAILKMSEDDYMNDVQQVQQDAHQVAPHRAAGILP